MVLFPSAVVLALTAALANAQTQNNTYLSGLLQTLNNAGLTSLASAVAFVNSTEGGNQLLVNLSDQGKNYTVFAPNNDACKSTSYHTALGINSNIRVQSPTYQVASPKTPAR